MRRRRRYLFVVLAALTACGGAGGSDVDPAVARGAELYDDKACASCHSIDGSELVGPTWKGLFGSEVRLSDGTTVTADEAYLRESMLQPSAKTVEGFQEGLMETVVKPNSLSDAEVAELIAYIKSLR